jgi:hypothetical protein
MQQILSYCVWHPAFHCSTLVEKHCDKATRPPLNLQINGCDLPKKYVPLFWPRLDKQNIKRRVIAAGNICCPAKHHSVHYRLNPPVNFTFWSVIKQHVLLNLTRMTRNLMNAERETPRMGKIKKQTEIYYNNRMQVFFCSETLFDGLNSYLGKQHKTVQAGKFVVVHKIYYFM